MLGMFEKHCPICGMDVKKETAIKRFGKYFCSEEHAERFTQQEIERRAKEPRSGGGCC